MSTTDYNQNPALRPTILVHEVMKNVYRPSVQAAEDTRTDKSAAQQAAPRAA